MPAPDATRRLGRLSPALILTLLAACSSATDVVETPVAVASIEVTAPVSQLYVGGTVQLTATPRDEAGRLLTARSVTWRSENASVATVSAGGVVSAIGPGSARIIATSGGHEGAVSLLVIRQHRLTIRAAGTGAGSIRGTNIDCRISAGQATGACTADFDAGARVELTVTADAGYGIEAWSGACATAESRCVVTMSQDQTVTVAFQRLRNAVTIRGAGTGTGRVTGTGVDCTITAGSTSGDCSEVVVQGSLFEVQATPVDNSSFIGWTGACETASTACAFVVTEDVTLQAEFDRPPDREVRIAGSGTGVGVVTGGPFNCRVSGATASGQCVADIPSGTRLTLTATPDAGHTFAEWSGACDGSSGRTCSFTVESALLVRARFHAPQAPVLTNIRIARITLNYSACNAEIPTLVEHAFDFTDANGDVPNPVSGTYGWVYHPDTQFTGSFDIQAEHSGTGSSGTIVSGICIAWGGQTSITSRFSIVDAAGNRSNTVQINVAKPEGALSPAGSAIGRPVTGIVR